MVKNPPANAGDVGSNPGSGRFPWRRKWQRTPIFLPGKSHAQRSLADYSPWAHKGIGHNLVTKQQAFLSMVLLCISNFTTKAKLM